MGEKSYSLWRFEAFFFLLICFPHKPKGGGGGGGWEGDAIHSLESSLVSVYKVLELVLFKENELIQIYNEFPNFLHLSTISTLITMPKLDPYPTSPWSSGLPYGGHNNCQSPAHVTSSTCWGKPKGSFRNCKSGSMRSTQESIYQLTEKN